MNIYFFWGRGWESVIFRESWGLGWAHFFNSNPKFYFEFGHFLSNFDHCVKVPIFPGHPAKNPSKTPVPNKSDNDNHSKNNFKHWLSSTPYIQNRLTRNKKKRVREIITRNNNDSKNNRKFYDQIKMKWN